MFHRAVSFVTILAFLTATLSCVRTTVPTGPQLLPRDEKLRVKALLTTSGQRIEFSGGTDARLSDDVLAIGPTSAPMKIGVSYVRSSSPGAGAETQFVLEDGLACTGRVEEQKNGVISLRASRLQVPVSLVDTLWVEHSDGGKRFLISLGIAAAAFGLAYLIILLTKESCPFVYSWDGADFILDGEPYGGATCPGLKRTDWGGLKYAKEVDGLYRFKLTNEVDETQYTDELKLVVVDHLADVAVVADEGGTLHSVRAPIAPTSAVDGRGRDILSYVKDDDWIYWQSQAAALEPGAPHGLKEALVFRFPKPAGASRAKLVFDGGNTLWGSQMVKRLLALHGRDLDRYYASLSAPGPAQFALLGLNMREELYRLNLRVSTAAGRVSKGSVAGGGPFVTRAKLYSIDISDVPGDVLEIQLTPPVGFWMINHVAMDYSDDVPLAAQELHAARAIDSHGTDIRDLLASVDGRYVTMPATGDSADLVFTAPPRTPGLRRSLILKANGYYDIHMGPLGEPQVATLARLRQEPGYAIRFSLEEFAKWRAGLPAGEGR